MATPAVSGAVALMYQVKSEINAESRQNAFDVYGADA